MKVFVAGATGVVGSRAVRLLAEAGHEVTGVARTPEKAAQLRAAGAEPVTVDLFDPGALKGAVVGHDAVCNLATHIPPITKAALPTAWKENDRIRTEASRNLVDAAVAAGAGRYVQESIAFIYPDAGDAWIDEDSPVEVASYMRSTEVAEGEAGRFTQSGGVGVVLRFGMFYGPGSNHTETMVASARRRIGPAIGDKSGYSSNIHLDDAASAVVAALSVPAGVYNVVEDEPLTRAEQMDALAAALGVGRLRSPSRLLAAVGGRGTRALARSQRISNRRFKQASGWSPRYPSVREGWPAVVAAI